MLGSRRRWDIEHTDIRNCCWAVGKAKCWLVEREDVNQVPGLPFFFLVVVVVDFFSLHGWVGSGSRMSICQTPKEMSRLPYHISLALEHR